MVTIVELRISSIQLLQMSADEMKAMVSCFPPGVAMTVENDDGQTVYVFVGEEGIVAAWLHGESVGTIREHFSSRTLPAEDAEVILKRIRQSHN